MNTTAPSRRIRLKTLLRIFAQLADELTNDAIYLSHLSRASQWLMCIISVFSRATAAFQYQRQDQGARHSSAQDQWSVSTNLFFAHFFFGGGGFSSLCLMSYVRPLSIPLSHPSSLAVLLYFPSYPLHIPHGPLFPVRGLLRRVSLGQVPETRGFHRKSILRLSSPSPFLLPSSAFLLSPALLHACSLFLPPSALFPVLPAVKVQHFLVQHVLRPGERRQMRKKNDTANRK